MIERAVGSSSQDHEKDSRPRQSLWPWRKGQIEVHWNQVMIMLFISRLCGHSMFVRRNPNAQSSLPDRTEQRHRWNLLRKELCKSSFEKQVWSHWKKEEKKERKDAYRLQSLKVSNIWIISSCSWISSSPPGRLVVKSFAWAIAFLKLLVWRKN